MADHGISRRRVLHGLAAVPLLGVVPAHTGPSPASSPRAGQPAPVAAPPRARVADLLRALDGLAAAAALPAYGIAIVDAAEHGDGNVLLDARGRLPDLDAGTPFRIGSITKTFTALAMLRLAEQQQIDLDATPVRALAPDASFTNPWEDAVPLTPAMLLEHTAGFGELSRREWDYAEPGPISLAEGLALDPSSRTCRWRPGMQHVYSNASPGLVAWIIERRQAAHFTDFVGAEVLTRLGMREAGFLPGDASARRLVPGFRADGRTPIPYWHQHILAYAALHASPRDMARLLHCLLDGGRLPFAVGERRHPTADSCRLLAPASVERMFTPRTSLAARSGLALGYGLGIYGSPRGGFVFHGHGGDADGYLSRFGLLRDARRGYFVVIDTDDPPLLARMRAAIERWLTLDLTPPAPPAVPVLTAAQLQPFVGRYRRAAARFSGTAGAVPGSASNPPVGLQGPPANAAAPTTPASESAVSGPARNDELEVSIEGGGLRLDGAVTASLVPTGTPGQFRPSPETVATSIFAADRGELYLLGDLGNFVRTPPRVEPR